MILDYVLYILVSAVGALLVGMIGTGSSLVVLPSLVLIFGAALAEYDAVRLAAGTTMATMAAGAIAGALTQYRYGNVDLKLLRLMLLPYVAGAMTGPWLSRIFSADALRFYVAVLISLVALRMILAAGVPRQRQRDYQAHRTSISVVLLLIGIGSSIAGIASGVFAIPWLMRFSIPLRTIIATSTAGAAVYSVCGAIGYVLAGWSVEALPAAALGYVYLPVFAVMALTAAVFAPLGVRLAGRVNEQVLKRVFAAFLVAAAVAIAFR